MVTVSRGNKLEPTVPALWSGNKDLSFQAVLGINHAGGLVD